MPVARVASFSSIAALPGVWRGDAWVPGPGPRIASGHAALDVELPGGGWPTGELIDILQPPGAQHEWRLLLPALRHVQSHGPLVLVGAPHRPHVAALAAQGVAIERLLWLDVAAATERLWAVEQVLRSGQAGAVLLWASEARPESLRRLHLAASTGSPAGQTHPGPLLFVLRAEALRTQSAPAPLRLWLGHRQEHLLVQVFKRRGPPMVRPVALAAALPVMACLRRHPSSGVSRGGRIAVGPATFMPVPAHVVDRPVAPAQPRQPSLV